MRSSSDDSDVEIEIRDRSDRDLIVECLKNQRQVLIEVRKVTERFALGDQKFALIEGQQRVDRKAIDDCEDGILDLVNVNRNLTTRLIILETRFSIVWAALGVAGCAFILAAVAAVKLFGGH